MHSTRITEYLTRELERLEEIGLRRHPRDARAADATSFCSNDYLGLASRFPPPATPSGAGASRLVDGEREAHAALESAFAGLVGAESALAFTSGYAANLGVISALAAPGDLVVSDALNHASLIDGMRLSRARVAVVPHNDLDAIARELTSRQESRAWVAVESYYSMDADGADLAALRAICDQADAGLIVDEAHALGVLGPQGRGRCAEAGITPDVLIGTLGKSFGSQGALVAGPSVLREWLWNRARSFVFSTGLSPAAADAGRRAIEESLRTPSLRERTLHNAARLRDALSGLPNATLLGFGHVVPLVVGTAKRAMAISNHLAAAGIDVPPIRPPTVPDGQARLRLTATGAQSDADIDRLAHAIRAAS
ncbi:MAG: 8-amino-7-oxononanoate synthase [Labilithrix sp.]